LKIVELRTFQDETIRTSKFQRLAELYKLTNTTQLREARKNIFKDVRSIKESITLTAKILVGRGTQQRI